jgi:hypothetical protein
MANSPTDTSKDFLESGKRLITSPSSDRLLEKARKEKEEKVKER